MMALCGCYESHRPPGVPVAADRVGCPEFLEVENSGANHACGITIAGDVLCWGSDEWGQRGGAERTGDRGTFRVDLGPAVQLEGGVRHTCALLDSGRIACWGWAIRGQLGTGIAPEGWRGIQPYPAEVVGVVDAVEIYGSGAAMAARLANGSFVRWGADLRARHVVEFSVAPRSDDTPVPLVEFGPEIVKLAIGSSHSCAIDADGRVFCIGANAHGENGHGGDGAEAEQAMVPGPMVDIAVGGHHTCAIDHQGQLHCWGSNEDGQLGVDSDGVVTPPWLSDVPLVKVDAYGGTTCVLDEQGLATCWGRTGWLYGPVSIRRFAGASDVEASRLGAMITQANQVRGYGGTLGACLRFDL